MKEIRSLILGISQKNREKSNETQVVSWWDEQCRRFEARKDVPGGNPVAVADPPGSKNYRPATAAEIGKKLGLARFRDHELDEFYRECERARNFGAFFNWYVGQRTPGAKKVQRPNKEQTKSLKAKGSGSSAAW